MNDNYEDIAGDLEVEASVIEHLTPFLHNGFRYSPNHYSRKNNFVVCVKKLIDENEEIDYEYVSEITCPYCGYKNTDSWEMPDESDNEYCDNCGSEYSYCREVTVEYCSQKIKKGILQEV